MVLYQFLCFRVHIFQVLDVLFLYHEDLGQPRLEIWKIRKSKGLRSCTRIRENGLTVRSSRNKSGSHHLDEELDRKPPQCLPLASGKSALPCRLADERVVVL